MFYHTREDFPKAQIDPAAHLLISPLLPFQFPERKVH